MHPKDDNFNNREAVCLTVFGLLSKFSKESGQNIPAKKEYLADLACVVEKKLHDLGLLRINGCLCVDSCVCRETETKDSFVDYI